MHGELIVRAARADELEEVGRLTLASYLADGMVSPEGTYARELADASRGPGSLSCW